MKKLTVPLIGGGLFLLILFFPQTTYAQTIDLLDFFSPAGCPQNFISNGEVFQCKPAGDNCFIIQKSLDPTYYERFCYDRGSIYHYEDTTWATEQGNVTCSGTNDEAYFTLLDGNWGTPGNSCAAYSPDREGMVWTSRFMSPGQCVTTEGTVIGFNKRTGECCETPYSGPGGGHTICLDFQGCIVFPTGVVSEDGVVLRVAGGAGAGENFYYDKTAGWVGFNRGTPNTGAYTTNPLSSMQPNEDCLFVTIEAPLFTLTCDPNNPGAQDSRPMPCDACEQTDLLCPSCATSFTVHDVVTYVREDDDYWCNDRPWLIKPWGGTVTINPGETTIPFVGKKKQESEQKYLADYLEGTEKYYASYPDPTEAMNHYGVFRKLAPQSVQDDFRKAMVYRAILTKAGTVQKGGVHDYLVEYSGESARLSEFAAHFPPRIDEEDYLDKYGAWKNSDGGKWYRLWPAVPMFSREDTPGYIYPYLGWKDNDQPKDIPAVVEKVPHVARLYEVSKAINRILSPLIQETAQAQTKTKLIIASAEEGILGEKTLLAQANPACGLPGPQPVSSCDQPAITDPNPNDTLCCEPININLAAEDHFINPVYEECIYSCDCCEAPVQRCPPGNEGQPGQECANLNKCDIAGGCNPACCGSDADCPGQPCNISNGYCRSGLSCNPATSSTQSVLAVYINGSCPAPCLCNPSCKDEFTQPVSRNFGINLSHPFLTQIWDYTGKITDGLFNIFRPETEKIPQFEELDAASEVKYVYHGGVTPGIGKFYFNYLGGVQKAKEWVVNEVLNPIR